MANFYGSYIGYGTNATQVAPYIYPKDGAGYLLLADRIDRLSFASLSGGATATDVGDSYTGTGTKGRLGAGHNSSETHMYHSGGYGPGQYSPNTADVIERMSFSSKGTSTDVGDLARHIRNHACTSSETHGYNHGGYRAVSDPSGAARAFSEIGRFAFGSSSNASDIGDLEGSVVTGAPSGHSDIPNSYGYCSAGGSYDGSSVFNTITRYVMTSATSNSVDVGDLTVSSAMRSGFSSETQGYAAGGNQTASYKIIDEFDFASSATAAKHGDLEGNYYNQCGMSSTTHGFSASGGLVGGGETLTDVQFFAFGSDADGADWGDITVATGYHSQVGSQGSE